MRFSFYGLNRTLCDVLEDMRRILNSTAGIRSHDAEKKMLKSLVEEAQVMGNRMEAGLSDIDDLESLHTQIKESREDLKKLELKIKGRKNGQKP